MKNYVKAILDEFEHSKCMKQVNTPASNNLFRVRKESEDILLSNEKASIFHSTIAKLLFLAK
jgi:hypothetical protein